MTKKPHILVVIPRGEAVRNFLYSDTLSVLSKNARVTLLSVIHDERFRERFGQYASICPLETCPESLTALRLRYLAHMAHFRWLWSGVARNKWETDDYTARLKHQRIRRLFEKALYRALAFRPVIELLVRLENMATIKLRSTNYFNDLYREVQPTLVFNASHVHGPAGILPVRAARDLGIPTVGFVFSWDNLTSRSRIMEPYSDYLVWTQQIKKDLLRIYPKVKVTNVHVTGTPQFDFHCQPTNWLTRAELAQRIGFDESRPFILYTTGIDRHFPEEHRMVELIIKMLQEMPQKPQLVVRNYVKGTSDAMQALMHSSPPDTFFPPMEWDSQWFMPTEEDQRVYTSMLRECALGINAASTVSLELMMFQKPIINLGFDPPGSHLPPHLRFSRHTDEFDHYIPVVRSGAVMVARSEQDMAEMLKRGLAESNALAEHQAQFLREMFDDTLDGRAGERIALCLLKLAEQYTSFFGNSHRTP